VDTRIDDAANDTAAIDTARPERRRIPRLLRQHIFLGVAVLCILIGGGFRFAAGTAASASTSGGSGASTACAAK
jgi:hypothetical protein